MNQIKYNPLYNYIKLNRKDTEQGRRYLIPDGSMVASVTTILDKTKSEQSKQSLQKWRNRVGEAQATEITKSAASRGTSMHKQLENWLLHGDLKTGGNLVHQTASKMAQVIIDQYLVNQLSEYWAIEASLYYTGLYAGTTDMAGLYNGRPSIIDFKQTNKPKKTEWIEDYFLQGAAYASAHNHLFETEIDQIVILMCSQNCEPQRWIATGNEFKHWQNKWYDRVEQFYS
jgi:hypothetical protein